MGHFALLLLFLSPLDQSFVYNLRVLYNLIREIYLVYQEVLQEASQRSSDCDLFIVVGSTLVIYPAAYMPIYAVRAGAKLIIVNLSDTPMDDDAEVLIRAKAGEAMSRIVEKVKDRLEAR